MRVAKVFNWKILALGAAIAVAHAGSVAAEVDNETREACRPDAWRLCAAFVPDVARITECMSAKIKEVSPECRAAMIHERDKARVRMQGPAAGDY
jgi:hypothetical protein